MVLAYLVGLLDMLSELIQVLLLVLQIETGSYKERTQSIHELKNMPEVTFQVLKGFYKGIDRRLYPESSLSLLEVLKHKWMDENTDKYWVHEYYHDEPRLTEETMWEDFRRELKE